VTNAAGVGWGACSNYEHGQGEDEDNQANFLSGHFAGQDDEFILEVFHDNSPVDLIF
jgi:hypothetical protein